MSYENTKTKQNLMDALAGESIARNKYTYFAEVARENGDENVAAAFEQMAKNEMMHAKFWYEALYGKETSTEMCLMKAAQGEYGEWHNMYPEFAKQAREEGFEDLAQQFEKVADIERAHENRFMTLMAKKKNLALENAPAEHREEPAEPRVLKKGYRCQFCGATYEDRPDVCSVCKAIGAFEVAEYYE